MVDFVARWSEKNEFPAERFITWIGIARSKCFDWRTRYGKLDEQDPLVPRDHWLTDEEQQKILALPAQNPLEGDRRLIVMMLDQDVVAAGASSVHRVLARAGVLDRWNARRRRRAPASCSRCGRTSTGTSTSPT